MKKKLLKRILSLVLAAASIVSLTACGNSAAPVASAGGQGSSGKAADVKVEIEY